MLPSWTFVDVILEAVEIWNSSHISLGESFYGFEYELINYEEFSEYWIVKIKNDYLNHRRLNVLSLYPTHSLIEARFISWLNIDILLYHHIHSFPDQTFDIWLDYHLHTHQEDRHCLNLFQQCRQDRQSCNLGQSICRTPSGSGRGGRHIVCRDWRYLPDELNMFLLSDKLNICLTKYKN